jgi:predicted O-methyltransferase YrrM
MSEPTDDDVSHIERPARETYQTTRSDGHTGWAEASLEDVKENFRRAQLLDDSVVFVKGKVEETLAESDKKPERIALLRLDTDWYESTKIELEVLYPRLVPGGVLIIDDYGHWAGARKAVDEYFKNDPVLVNRIGYTARLVVRR